MTLEAVGNYRSADNYIFQCALGETERYLRNEHGKVNRRNVKCILTRLMKGLTEKQLDEAQSRVSWGTWDGDDDITVSYESDSWAGVIDIDNLFEWLEDRPKTRSDSEDSDEPDNSTETESTGGVDASYSHRKGNVYYLK